MPQQENVALQPVRDGGVELVKLAGEKVVGTFHNHKMVFSGKGSNNRLDLPHRAVLVLASVHEELWLVALVQKGKIAAVNWDTQSNQMRDALVFAANTQPHPRSKTESGEQ